MHCSAALLQWVQHPHATSHCMAAACRFVQRCICIQHLFNSVLLSVCLCMKLAPMLDTLGFHRHVGRCGAWVREILQSLSPRVLRVGEGRD
jgi:hypothetical protein